MSTESYTCQLRLKSATEQDAIRMQPGSSESHVLYVSLICILVHYCLTFMPSVDIDLTWIDAFLVTYFAYCKKLFYLLFDTYQSCFSEKFMRLFF